MRNVKHGLRGGKRRGTSEEHKERVMTFTRREVREQFQAREQSLDCVKESQESQQPHSGRSFEEHICGDQFGKVE